MSRADEHGAMVINVIEQVSYQVGEPRGLPEPAPRNYSRSPTLDPITGKPISSGSKVICTGTREDRQPCTQATKHGDRRRWHPHQVTDPGNESEQFSPMTPVTKVSHPLVSKVNHLS
jgi:hypothetical protein